MNEDNKCPVCKAKIIKKQISKDLIALNIINDMQVTCNNLGKRIPYFFLECPWKGPLSELTKHLKICPFDEKRISENVKKQLNKGSSTETRIQFLEDNDNTGDYLSFNPKNASLKARLFQKNPQLIGKVLNEEDKQNGDFDIFSLLGAETKHIPENLKHEVKSKQGDENKFSAKTYEECIKDNNDKIEECDINFIYPNNDYNNFPKFDSHNNIINSNNSNNLLNTKRIRKNKRIGKNKFKKEENHQRDSNPSEEDLEEEEKRQLEYILELSLKEYAKSNNN